MTAVNMYMSGCISLPNGLAEEATASPVSMTCSGSLSYSGIYMYIHALMRDEKKGRKKKARSNKQQGKATQHTQGSDFS